MKEILLPLLAILLGLIFGYFVPLQFPQALAVYMAVAILACLDTLLGGIRSYIFGEFKLAVFIAGFLTDAVLAFALLFLGEELLEVSLTVIVLVLYGMRLFKNFSSITMHIVQSYRKMKMEKINKM